MRKFLIASTLGLGILGLIGFAPDASAHDHKCSTDCGYYTNQELRDSGDYLGPATPNAHSGNVYEH